MKFWGLHGALRIANPKRTTRELVLPLINAIDSYKLTTPSRQFAGPNHCIERCEELGETEAHSCQHCSQHFQRHAALAPLEPADVGRVDAYSKGKSFLGTETSLQAKLLETSANLGA